MTLRLGFLVLLLAACAGNPRHQTDSARQLVVVTTAHWDSTAGTLRRFERLAGQWQPVGGAVPIVVGRTGLAWGIGFERTGPHKREGDGRSPAGIFPLAQAFGFTPSYATSLPWLPLTPTIECVDDTASVHYNRIVDRERVRVDWNSSEKMRQIGLYRLGVEVAYNQDPATKGRGSCIFLHVWNGPHSTTAGCTAMDERALADLVAWLDPRARPLLAQVPRAGYAALQREFALPPL